MTVIPATWAASSWILSSSIHPWPMANMQGVPKLAFKARLTALKRLT